SRPEFAIAQSDRISSGGPSSRGPVEPLPFKGCGRHPKVWNEPTTKLDGCPLDLGSGSTTPGTHRCSGRSADFRWTSSERCASDGRLPAKRPVAARDPKGRKDRRRSEGGSICCSRPESSRFEW